MASTLRQYFHNSRGNSSTSSAFTSSSSYGSPTVSTASSSANSVPPANAAGISLDASNSSSSSSSSSTRVDTRVAPSGLSTYAEADQSQYTRPMISPNTLIPTGSVSSADDVSMDAMMSTSSSKNADIPSAASTVVATTVATIVATSGSTTYTNNSTSSDDDYYSDDNTSDDLSPERRHRDVPTVSASAGSMTNTSSESKSTTPTAVSLGLRSTIGGPATTTVADLIPSQVFNNSKKKKVAVTAKKKPTKETSSNGSSARFTSTAPQRPSKKTKNQEDFPALAKSTPKTKNSGQSSLSSEIERLKSVSASRGGSRAASSATDPIIKVSIDVHNSTCNDEKLYCLEAVDKLSKEKKLDFKVLTGGQFTRMTASVPLSLIPAVSTVVDPISVATLGPAINGNGRGEQLLTFLSDTPTYRELYRALELSRFRVFPVLSPDEWDMLFANSNTCIPSKLRILSGAPVWQREFSVFDKLIFTLTSKSFTAQNATRSFAQAFVQGYVVTNLLNEDTVYAFSAIGGQFGPDEASELSKTLAKCPTYLGFTVPRWRRLPPGVREETSSHYCFYFACGDNTETIESATEQVYASLGGTYKVGKGDTRLILQDAQRMRTSWKAAQEHIKKTRGVHVPWSGRKDVCRHCGDLHPSVLCPMLVAACDNQHLIQDAVKVAEESAKESVERYSHASDPCYADFLSSDYASSVLEKENIPLPRRQKELKTKPKMDPQAMRLELAGMLNTTIASSTTNSNSTNSSVPTEVSTAPRSSRILTETGPQQENVAMSMTSSGTSSWSLVARRSASKKRRSQQL